MSDFGVDIWAVDDFLPDMPTVTGKMAVAQAAARRLQVPRGLLEAGTGWADYGLNLRGFLLSSKTVDDIASAVRAEIEKDERVDRAHVSVLMTESSVTVSVPIEPDDETDPFEFVFTVTADKAALLVA